jgi:hypothetical protein
MTLFLNSAIFDAIVSNRLPASTDRAPVESPAISSWSFTKPRFCDMSTMALRSRTLVMPSALRTDAFSVRERSEMPSSVSMTMPSASPLSMRVRSSSSESPVILANALPLAVPLEISVAMFEKIRDRAEPAASGSEPRDVTDDERARI